MRGRSGEVSQRVPRFPPALLLTFPKVRRATGTKAKGGGRANALQRGGICPKEIGDGFVPGTEPPRVQKSSACSSTSAGSLRARLHLPPAPGVDQRGD